MKVPTLFAACALALALAVSIGCGSAPKPTSNSPSTVNLSLSDPATCSAPLGSFSHIFVTVTDVQINASASAGDNDGNWIDLTPSLKSSPQQVDLLGIAGNQCFLAMLGSKTELQPGTYQQIRVILADNSTTIANNNCKTAGANCVVLASSSTPQTLQLSSEAKTGIKIPSGQIAGGQFKIAAGETKDLDIDFNACASIVQQGNGQFRLKPVLHAGEVSTTSASINGTVVDSATHQPISGGAVLVALEQKDVTNTTATADRIIMETKADSTGAFVFCPVPAGSYDIIAVGVDGAGKSYAATATLGVGPGSALGNIPLVAVSGTNPAQATITGLVTTAPAATATDVLVSAEQQVNGSVLIIVPLVQQLASSLTVTTQAPASSGGTTCPTNTACANYSLGVPAANPNVGTFSASGTTYTQASGAVAYTVGAQALSCNPLSASVSTNSTNGQLTVTAATTSTAANITLSGCQ